MQATPPKPFERILAVRLDNIGDVVMTSPALRALKRAYPAAHLTLLASPAGSQVAPLLPWVEDVITWRAIWQDISKNVPANPEKEMELVRLLAARNFDAAFIFTSFSQSPHPPAYACYLAGIPIRVGQSKEFGGGLLSTWVLPVSDNQYQAARNLYLLRGAGIPVEDESLELQVPAQEQRSTGELLSRAGIRPDQPFLALAPGASAEARRYPEAGFAQAIQSIQRKVKLPVVLVGSPRESGAFPILEGLADQQRGVVSLIGKTSVTQMADVIRRSALLIGNNSGAMHMASAFRRPMVILYSGTETFEQWAPRTGQTVLLNREVECSPCHNFRCPYAMECLAIDPEEVAAQALSLLKSISHSFSGVSAGSSWR